MSIKKFVALSLTLVLFHNFVIPFAYANGLYLAPPAAFFYFLILITYGIFSPAVLIYLLPITLGILFERTYILTRSFAVTVCLIVFIGPLFSWFSIGSGSSIFASYYLFFVTIFLLFTFLITIMSFLFSSLGNKIAIVRNLQFRINGLSSRFKIGLILLSYLLTILLIFISNEIPLLLSKSSMFVYPFITYLIFFLFILFIILTVFIIRKAYKINPLQFTHSRRDHRVFYIFLVLFILTLLASLFVRGYSPPLF